MTNARNDKVCVVVITYNQATYIKSAIESILDQDLNENFEVLVCDDCSVDNTKQVVRSIIDSRASERGKINYRRHSENLGYRNNFIWAMKQVQSDYIAFCEGDDYWADTTKLSKQVAFLDKNHDVGVVFTDTTWYDSLNGQYIYDVLKTNKFRHVIDFDDHLINANYYAPLTWLFRRSLLDDVDWTNFTTDGTYTLMLHFLKKTAVHFMHDTTAIHRVLTDSISHNTKIEKHYDWWKGICETQKLVANKQKVNATVRELMFIKMYSTALDKYAYVVDDKSILDEANLFFNQNNLSHISSAFKSKHFFSETKKRRGYKCYISFLRFINSLRSLLSMR